MSGWGKKPRAFRKPWPTQLISCLYVVPSWYTALSDRGPCGQALLVHALNLCLHVKIPLVSILIYANTWGHLAPETRFSSILPGFNEWLGLLGTRTAERAGQPSIWCMFCLCFASKKLHIAAVWGELGSLTPSSRARLNAVWTGSIIPSSTCYCPHCPPGSRAVFSHSWSTPSVNLCNNLLKASFLHWAHGFRQPQRPLGHLDVDSCLWILFYLANPWGKIKCISSDLTIFMNVPWSWRDLGEPCKCSFVSKSVEISWLGSLLAFLNTAGKIAFEVTHLQIHI